jgi:hypothetical protein
MASMFKWCAGTFVVACAASASALVYGCSDDALSSAFVGPTDGGNSKGDDATVTLLPPSDGSLSTEVAPPCVGLCKQQVSCPGGGTTSLSGVVKDPAGKVPLYNVLVFVPNAPVAPITQGASCDRCGSVSGDPLVSAITDAQGRFRLTNVPVGDNIPLVVQVGKWRRQIVIPTVGKCQDTPLQDESVRLPRNKQEGDLPQIAITTGGADVLECLLRKIGVDDSEFTTPDKPGRVHFYAGAPGGNSTTTAFSADAGGGKFPPASEVWESKSSLMKYDLVLLSCEGDTYSAQKPTPAVQAMYEYANAGGRVFASHWHRYWFDTSKSYNSEAGAAPSPFPSVGAWIDRDPGPADPSVGKVDTSFPKGKALSEWLGNVGGSPTGPGTLPIKEPRHNIDSVDAQKAQQWITVDYTQDGGARSAVEYLSFNTPIQEPDDKKCGRVVYSDLHVSSGDQRGKLWPSGCIQPDLSPQEKALEFMLFDLSACVQSDKEPPKAPAVR